MPHFLLKCSSEWFMNKFVCIQFYYWCPVCRFWAPPSCLLMFNPCWAHWHTVTNLCSEVNGQTWTTLYIYNVFNSVIFVRIYIFCSPILEKFLPFVWHGFVILTLCSQKNFKQHTPESGLFSARPHVKWIEVAHLLKFDLKWGAKKKEILS